MLYEGEYDVNGHDDNNQSASGEQLVSGVAVTLKANQTYSLVNANENDKVRITSILVSAPSAPANTKQVPIEVKETLIDNNSVGLTATGIVGLVSYADSSEYITNNLLVKYDSGITPQVNKFLLDTSNYEVKHDSSDGQYIVIDSVGTNTSDDMDNDKFISISYYQDKDSTYFVVEDDNKYYSSFSEAISSTEFKNYFSSGYRIAIIVHKNRTLSGTISVDDRITIPSGSNVTITSSGSSSICTLSLGENFAFGETLFTVEKDAELTLNNIIIDGNKERVVSDAKDGGNLIVENNGTFTLGENATIQNNRGTSDYASVIEIGRGNTVTNINGTIQNNEGYYGAIYSVYSTTVINISDNAK